MAPVIHRNRMKTISMIVVIVAFATRIILETTYDNEATHGPLLDLRCSEVPRCRGHLPWTSQQTNQGVDNAESHRQNHKLPNSNIPRRNGIHTTKSDPESSNIADFSVVLNGKKVFDDSPESQATATRMIVTILSLVESA
jgi:hypothetical protein